MFIFVTYMQYRQVRKYQSLIQECYASDHALINKFHITAGTGLDNCIDNTLVVLRSKAHKLKIFEVLEDGKRVGYFGSAKKTDPPILNTWFVMPEYRNPVKLSLFWKVIIYHFKSSFMTAIYSKNTRAESFLLRGGCEFLCEKTWEEDSVKIFAYKN